MPCVRDDAYRSTRPDQSLIVTAAPFGWHGSVDYGNDVLQVQWRNDKNQDKFCLRAMRSSDP
jgi:hypothetical protein